MSHIAQFLPIYNILLALILRMIEKKKGYNYDINHIKTICIYLNYK
jgi:hypothetical protein